MFTQIFRNYLEKNRTNKPTSLKTIAKHLWCTSKIVAEGNCQSQTTKKTITNHFMNETNIALKTMTFIFAMNKTSVQKNKISLIILILLHQPLQRGSATYGPGATPGPPVSLIRPSSPSFKAWQAKKGNH